MEQFSCLLCDANPALFRGQGYDVRPLSDIALTRGGMTSWSWRQKGKGWRTTCA